MNNLHLDIARRALDRAQSRPDIQLMLRTGSRARRDNTVDQYSRALEIDLGQAD